MTPDGKKSVVGLGVIAVLFCALRVPVLYRQPGGYDEDFYSVPGLTILADGIPRLPHVPARNPESAFYRAERVLYSEPPLYFYLQAAFYRFLPPVYGTARLASGLAGLLLLACVYRLARLAGAGTAAALAATGLFSFSRWFFFPATCARPDVLCGLWGFLALLVVLRWRDTPRLPRLALAGGLLGLGGLTHFYAIIYAVQLAVVVALASRRWGRLLNPVVLAACAVAVFGLWLPMIALDPEAFRVQIANQFSEASGRPLWQRLLLPREAISYQLPMMWGHIGAAQWLAPGGAAAWSLLSARARQEPVLRLAGWLAATSIGLICVLVGKHHPVIGYWVYPAGLMFVCLAVGLQRCAERIGARDFRLFPLAPGAASAPVGLIVVFAAALGAAFLPGSGLRASYVYLQRWHDVNYDAPRFARKLLEETPAEAVCAVDAPFLLDFVAAGRPTLLASVYPPYFRVDQFEYDRLILSRHALDESLGRKLGAVLLRTEGIQADRFACYVEIYAPPPRQGGRLGGASPEDGGHAPEPGDPSTAGNTPRAPGAGATGATPLSARGKAVRGAAETVAATAAAR